MISRIRRWFGPKSILLGLSAAAGCYALYFARLGSYPLLDSDEPFYGQVAKEMASGAGWLTPHYDGRLWFDKPPLFYWISAVFARLFGPTELAYRLPSALMALALILLVYALASYDFGKRVGILSALVIGTCVQQIILARAAVTDMTFTVCLIASLYAYRRWLDARNRDRYGWAVLCGAMTGLAMLAKGPVAPVLLLVTFIIHMRWTRRLKRITGADALTGVAAAMIVGLPWFIAMYVLHRDAFVQGFLIANNFNRMLHSEHPEQTGQWYSHFINLPIFFAFFFPWSIFLPGAIRRNWRLNLGTKLAAVWIGVVFVFFSMSKTILPTYIFPLYPAAAIFVGTFIHLAASKDISAVRGVRLALWVTLSVSVLLLLAAVSSAHSKYPGSELAAGVMGGILVVFSACALTWLCRRTWAAPAAAYVIGAGMAVFALWLVAGVLPLVIPRQSTRDLVAHIPRNPQAKIAAFGFNKVDLLGNTSGLLTKPSLLYYVGPHLIRVNDVSAAVELLSSRDPVFLICRQDAEKGFSVPGSTVLAKSGDLEVFTNKAGVALKGLKQDAQ